MNINEYIEKHSTIDVDKKAGLVTVTMEVPPKKEITYKHQECEASQKVRVRTGDVQGYLTNSGIEILSVQKDDSINNNIKLTARWEYNIAPAAKKKNKKNSRKDSLKEIIEDIS
jgi:hypothetical protein